MSPAPLRVLRVPHRYVFQCARCWARLAVPGPTVRPGWVFTVCQGFVSLCNEHSLRDRTGLDSLSLMLCARGGGGGGGCRQTRQPRSEPVPRMPECASRVVGISADSPGCCTRPAGRTSAKKRVREECDARCLRSAVVVSSHPAPFPDYLRGRVHYTGTAAAGLKSLSECRAASVVVSVVSRQCVNAFLVRRPVSGSSGPSLRPRPGPAQRAQRHHCRVQPAGRNESR